MSAFLRNLGQTSLKESVSLYTARGRRRIGSKLIRNIGALRRSSAATSATITFVTSVVDTTNATTYTFSGLTLSADMVVSVVGYHATTGTLTLASATIGGVAATIHVSADGTNDAGAAIFAASGITPGTGDVAVTWNTGARNCAIGTWNAVNRATAAHHTAKTEFAAPDADPSVSLNIPANGFAVALMFNADISTIAWTNLTERFDETIESLSNHSGASDNFTAAETGRSITAARSIGAKGQLCAVSFAPA